MKLKMDVSNLTAFELQSSIEDMLLKSVEITILHVHF